MNGIQILLITLSLVIGIYFFIRLRSSIADTIFLFLLIGSAITLILFPNITTKAARWLHVGRGADLVFYISTMLFWFLILKLYARQRKLEQTLTQIIRHQSLQVTTEQKNKPAADEQQSGKNHP